MHGQTLPVTPLGETVDSPKHPIRPDDFNFSNHNTPLSSVFGKSEVEQSAGKLIQFFQSRGRWCEFTIDELRRFYELKGWNYNSAFFGLTGAWYDDGGLAGGWAMPKETYLAFDDSGKAFVTAAFVERCGRNLKKRAA
jgi:hypothetical protein